MARRVAAVLAALAVSLTLLGAAPTPDSGPPCCKNGWVYRAENIRSSYPEINFRQELKRCHIHRAKGTCTISETREASVTVEVTAGVSRGIISGQLGFGRTKSVSVSVSCTSPVLRKGQSWVAYPLGRLYTYNITKQDAMGFFKKTVVKRNAKAFKPYGGFSCGVW
jgi:hypothetical protein